jgi:hypothetical protein
MDPDSQLKDELTVVPGPLEQGATDAGAALLPDSASAATFRSPCARQALPSRLIFQQNLTFPQCEQLAFNDVRSERLHLR